MSSGARSAVAAGLVLLAYSLVSAILARGLGLTWRQAAWLNMGNWLIYLAAGFAAAWRSSRIWTGLAAAVAAGLADGLMGWRINWAISRLPRFFRDHDGAEFTFLFEALLVATVLGTAGAVAGWLAGRLRGRVRSAAA